ncbi:MAG: oxidoreductase [Phycisphaeraceae bacterium]|nr:MAG: oxidoreductase [Phycisphaeraceae bacterium]
MTKRLASTALTAALVGASASAPPAVASEPDSHPPLRIVVIGLTHGHVEGVLHHARDRTDIDLVGVWDPNPTLFDKFKGKYALDDGLYYDDLGAMLDETKPQAASVMTSTLGHRAAVEACAPRGVHVMVEKPLATTGADARAMAALAEQHGVHLLTNYETSWYASNRRAGEALASGEIGTLRRAVFRHGHKGPVEIGCAPEFLEWLTDPEENGAGALFDFGCYGANLMTWFMEGQRPESVTATTRRLKPGVYPRVDDDATIVLAYPSAVAVLQASWAWTHSVKETDVYAEGGSVHAGPWRAVAERDPDAQPVSRELLHPAAPMDNEWSYLRALVQGRCGVDPLSSLENNLLVVEILAAARESARTGEAVRLAD